MKDGNERDYDLMGPLEEEVDFFFSSFLGSSYPSIYREELCWKPPTDVYETEFETDDAGNFVTGDCGCRRRVNHASDA